MESEPVKHAVIVATANVVVTSVRGIWHRLSQQIHAMSIQPRSKSMLNQFATQALIAPATLSHD